MKAPTGTFVHREGIQVQCGLTIKIKVNGPPSFAGGKSFFGCLETMLTVKIVNLVRGEAENQVFLGRLSQ